MLVHPWVRPSVFHFLRLSACLAVCLSVGRQVCMHVWGIGVCVDVCARVCPCLFACPHLSFKIKVKTASNG